MAGTDSQHNAVTCPGCGAENFDFAAFCIGCGEPLGTGRDLPFGSRGEDDEPEDARFDPDEERISVPRRPGRKARLWETGIGVVILVLVVGYGLFTWESTNIKSSAYHQGESAAQAKDWEKAAGDYARAGDFMDATRKSRDARQKISDRNLLYARGVRAQNKSDWEAALSDFQQVHAIQPGYLDADKHLAALEDRVFDKGLEGLVYQVRQGPDPGLYIRDSLGKSHLLPGSDANSALRAVSGDRISLVYDIPDGQRGNVQSPQSGATGQRTEMLGERQPDGSVSARPLGGLQSAGSGVFTTGGLWWYTPQLVSPQPQPRGQPRPQFQGGFGRGGNYDVYYASLDGGSAAVKISDSKTGTRVLATDTARSRIILARPVGPQDIDSWQTAVFVAGADGQGARLLQTVPGQVSEASITSDGRWVLLVSIANLSNAERLVLALRVDYSTQPGEALLRQLDETVFTGPRVGPFPGASLLSSDAGKHLVLLSHYEAYGDELEIVDLDSGTSSLLWSGPPSSAGFLRAPSFALSPDGRYAVVQQQEKGQSSLQVLDVSHPLTARPRAPLAADMVQLFRLQFAPQSGYLFATVISRQTYSLGSGQQVYASRILSGGQLGEMQKVATTAVPRGNQSPTVATPNRELLAFVNPVGELHAIFADGTGDTRLATGVAAVWSLQPTGDPTTQSGR